MKFDKKPLFTCVLCDCKLRSKINLKNHLKKHVRSKGVNLSNENKQPPVRKFACAMCNRKYFYPTGIDRHLKQHLDGTDVLPISNLKPKLRYSLVKAMVESGKKFESDKPFQCHVCGQGFSSKSKMQRHALIHDIHALLTCDICGYSTHRYDTLSDHRLTHSTDKNYTCHKCHKMFKTYKILKNHIIFHEGSTLLVCPICSTETKSLGKFKAHLHGHKKDTPKEMLAAPLLEVKDMCQQLLSDNNLFFYQQNKKSIYPKLEKITYSKKQPTIFLCNVCGYMSNRKHNYLVHSLIHNQERPYKCDYCVYSSKSPSNLSKHRARCHVPKYRSTNPH